MSKHNYTKYSDNKKKNPAPEAHAVSAETLRPIPEAVAPAELVEETVNIVALPEMVEGVVANCAKLNVRAEPNIDAKILCVLDAMSEIEVNVNQSVDEWFKICTATGVEGYCMRKFIDAYL